MTFNNANMNIKNQIKARFKRRILHAPNAIQTLHNEEAYLIIYCLNCIRCMQNSTFETGLMLNRSWKVSLLNNNELNQRNLLLTLNLLFKALL